MRKPKLSKERCPICDQYLPRTKRLRTTIRITEAATLLGCSAKTVERRTDEGKIRCLPRYGTAQRRYLKSEIERYKKTLKRHHIKRQAQKRA